MNFKEFQATGRDVENLDEILGVDPESLSSVKGRIYSGDVYLEQMNDGRFYCIVFNEDIIDASLEVVEKFLYDATFTDGECCI